jgi:hypothetical protein
MGFFQKIGEWIKPAVRVVRYVVETIDDCFNGPSISEEYGELTRKILPSDFVDKKPGTKPPDFISQIEISKIDNEIGDVRKTMTIQCQEQAVTNKTLAIQTEIMKLALCASAFDRYTNNIRLHASNLSIHLQTIRNVKGLTDDVNSLRFGLKRAIGTINHMANIINGQNSGKVEKIEGVDIDMKDGAISLNAAYRTFEKTKDLLVEEIAALSNLSDEHMNDVRMVQERAAELGPFGQKIIDYLDEKVLPKLTQTKKLGLNLKNEIKSLPIIPHEENIEAENGHN